MSLNDVAKDIPEGKFRVVMRIEGELFCAGDYEAFPEARAIARIKEKEEINNDWKEDPVEINFYVINDACSVLYIAECDRSWA